MCFFFSSDCFGDAYILFTCKVIADAEINVAPASRGAELNEF